MKEEKPIAPFFQVGIVVADLEAAMDELGTALGLDWAVPQDRHGGGISWRVTIGRPGPPFIELIEGGPGTPWDASAGNRIDHVAIWSDELAAERRRLEAAGMELDVDGGELSGPWWYYMRGPQTGLRVEIIDESRKESLYHTYGLDD